MKRLSDDLIRQALSDHDLTEYERIVSRLARNSRSIPTRLASGASLSETLIKMVRDLEPRLGMAEADAQKDRREKNAAEMPWVHKASPKQVLQDIERLEWHNARILAFAAEMTAKYTIIGEMLKTHRFAALSVMQREDEELGKALVSFLRRLKRQGLRAESVKDLPNGVIGALVALLNGESEVDLAGALGLEVVDFGDLDGMTLDEQQDALDRQLSVLKAEVESFTGYRDLRAALGEERPVPPDPDKWDYTKGALPRAFWSHIMETVDYRFDDREATPAEREAMRAMPLPLAHNWLTLWTRDKKFSDVALNPPPRRRSGVENHIKDFLGPKIGVHPESVDQNTIRAWLYLLVARHLEEEESIALFGERYFEGVMLPLDDARPGYVRVLQWAMDD